MTLADFAVPGDLATATGGYAYDRAMLAACPALRHVPTPMPEPARFAEIGAALRGAGPLLLDGLLAGALPAEMLVGLGRPLVALCHHPLGYETGLDPRRAAAMIAAERAALSACAAVVTTSAATAALLRAEFGVVDPVVIEPGLALRDAAPRAGDPPVLLTLASMSPRKGHDVLLAALERIADLPWRAVWAGAAPDPDWAGRIEALRAASPVGSRIEWLGPVAEDQRDALVAGADLFCLPTHYEGYGMVFAEAMMAGLPVVATAGGAVADVVPKAAGRVVEPGDAQAVADALRSYLTDADAATRAAAAGRAHALTLPGWTEQGAALAAVLRGIAT